MLVAGSQGMIYMLCSWFVSICKLIIVILFGMKGFVLTRFQAASYFNLLVSIAWLDRLFASGEVDYGVLYIILWPGRALSMLV